MRYTNEICTIISKSQLASGVVSLSLNAPVITAAASCGQFVNIMCDGYLLRRPISICWIDTQNGELRIVLEARGKGTKWLAERQAGENLDVVGPLGHGFPLDDNSLRAVLVGGGIGTPPLLPIAQFYGKNATVITGFRNAEAAILQNDFMDAGAHTILCTDDGSAGFHGFTTQALSNYIQENHCDVIYTCGPIVMMRAVAKIANEKSIACYVSMEERMGCGVGACLCCTCATKSPKGGTQHTRVCLNGPVFKAEEVEWDA